MAAASRERLVTRFVGAGLVVFVAAAIGPSLVGHNTLLSVNEITGDFPWLSGGSKVGGHQLCSGDTIDSVLPGISYIRTQLAQGRLPNWQGLVAGGSPLGSQPNLGMLNPLSLPYYILPLWLAPAFVKLLQFVVAIGGTFLFLRRHSVGRAAAMLGGFTFAVSGFMVMWTNWPQTQVAAFIPALFWASERLIQRARLTDCTPLALVVAFMLLGGFPAVTGWALYAAAAYVLVRLLSLYRRDLPQLWRRFGLAAGGLVLGLLLAMVQMLPFALSYASTDFSYRDYMSRASLPSRGLVTLVAPDANGLCVGGKLSWGTWNPVELVAYIGAAAMVLVVVGMAAAWRRPAGFSVRGVRGYFVVTIVVVVLLCWGGGVALRLVDHVPVFSGNLIGRIRSLFGFLLAVFAGFGFDALMVRYREQHHRPTAEAGHEADSDIAGQSRGVRRAWPLSILVAWVVFGIVVVWMAMDYAHTLGYRPVLADRLRVPALLVLASAIAVFLAYRRRPALNAVAVYVLPILMLVQGFQFFHAVLPGDSRSNFYPVTATHQFLAANLGSDRFVATGTEMYPATSMYYGLRTVTGHTFQEPQWQALLQAVDPHVMKTATFSELSTQLTPPELGTSKVLDRMAAKYMVFDPAGLTGVYDKVARGTGQVSIASGQQASCTLAPGALRGVTVWLAKDWTPPSTGGDVTLEITVSTGGEVIHSARYLGAGAPAGAEISVAVAGEDLPKGAPVTVTVSGTGGGVPLVLSGLQGVPTCGAVRPADDGLKLVFADAGSIVYERSTALPRIRWASSAVVLSSQDERVAALVKGLPGDEVVLDAPGVTPAGKPATVSVNSDNGDEIGATVDAAGAGYLVVADALQADGWSVTVDGKPAKLVPADEAMVAVAVPAGVHHVTLSYRAPGQRDGAILSVFAIVVMIGLALAQRFFRSEGRRRVNARIDHPGSVLSGHES